MASDYTGSPKFIKGALAVYESQYTKSSPQMIIFQYNPNQLTRSLTARTPPPPKEETGSAKAETLKVSGPPVENIKVTVTLDAADQLQDPDSNQKAVDNGIGPTVSALEMLLYPPEDRVIENDNSSKEGSSESQRTDAPMVLFIWGPSRVVPVQLTEFSVTEEAFDQNLNPIRAKVALGMKVLTYAELTKDNLGYGVYKSAISKKEEMARSGMTGNTEQYNKMLPK